MTTDNPIRSQAVRNDGHMAKNVIIAASLGAPADQLYEMYLDPQQHAAITGSPVSIGPSPGTAFSAFEGMLSGVILHVVPKRLIIQTWRSANWASDAIDSTLTLSFHQQGENGRIELAHINIPDEDFSGVSHGWEKFYWAPWRALLNS